ncbi:MAG: hypothetical protein KME05_15445 [Gloeocapsa sp. UFS-A4-WI-NPMV-4B04]|jgi:hypothetical protein|nr:hypothetical protein [Gloeocapsa sp. UFS-A4-WI-NPMV-4B04]
MSANQILITVDGVTYSLLEDVDEIDWEGKSPMRIQPVTIRLTLSI